MKASRLLLGLWALLVLLPLQAADNLNAFPAADAGMVRYVLQLPEQQDEADFRVELVAGQTVEVDPANRYFFAGTIANETIPGWGFVRYMISSLGPMAGTLMAINPGTAKVRRFIALGGETYLIRYNSRVPIVVYAPEGVEVRYRIWRTGPETTAMDRG